MHTQSYGTISLFDIQIFPESNQAYLLKYLMMQRAMY